MTEAIFRCGSRLDVVGIGSCELPISLVAIKFKDASDIIFYTPSGLLHPEHESPFDIMNIDELIKELKS